MIVGVLKEIKSQENRVCMTSTPAGVMQTRFSCDFISLRTPTIICPLLMPC